MFAKLKKKIQEEAQNVVGTPEGDRRNGAKATSPGPGLASPVSKDYPEDPSLLTPPRGPIFGHSRKDSDASSKMGSRASSVDDIARESTSKEEVLAMLMKRTEQVKKLEAKISELAAMIKEKNRRIDKLETSLQTQQNSATKLLEEMTEKYEAERSKVSEGYKAAVASREEELRLGVKKEMEDLKKKNVDLDARLKQSEQQKNQLFKKEEEKEELQGLGTQELAKVKHMFLMSQDELKQRSESLTAADRKVSDLEIEVHSLMSQIETLTAKSEESEETNRALTRSLDDVHLAKDDVTLRLKEKTAEIEKLESLLAELQTSSKDVESSRQQALRDSEAKSEEISHLQDRVTTLEQRLQTGELSGDDRVKALEEERESLEKKLSSSRDALTDLRSSLGHQVETLDAQVSDLQAKVKVGAADLSACQRELSDVRSSLTKEVESWKSKLQMALLEVKEKERLVETLTSAQTAEKERQQKTATMMEDAFRDQLRQLKGQLDSTERAKERERTAQLEKIARLESGQEDWLEREIDSERQITRLEEDLHKTKVEYSEKEKEILGYKKQIILKTKELEDSEAKRIAAEKIESTLNSTQQELNSCVREKDELLLRNAQLSQDHESHKRRATQELGDLRQEVSRRDAAVAGLEQALLDAQRDHETRGKQLSDLEGQRSAALDKVESEEISRLRTNLDDADTQLADKNKTIKMLQQRLTDLKKTLQRELKVQALPNDEPPASIPKASSSSSLSTAATTAKDSMPGAATNGVDSHPPSISVSQQHTDSRKHHRTSNKAYIRPYPPDVYNAQFAGGGVHMSSVSSSSMPSVHYSGSATRQLPRTSGGKEEVNFEYLKHVILKFLLSREHEAIHLIKAVSMLLHFTPEEQRLIKDTLEWKMSWFGARPQLGRGQSAKIIPSIYYND